MSRRKQNARADEFHAARMAEIKMKLPLVQAKANADFVRFTSDIERQRIDQEREFRAERDSITAETQYDQINAMWGVNDEEYEKNASRWLVAFGDFAQTKRFASRFGPMVERTRERLKTVDGARRFMIESEMARQRAHDIESGRISARTGGVPVGTTEPFVVDGKAVPGVYRAMTDNGWIYRNSPSEGSSGPSFNQVRNVDKDVQQFLVAELGSFFKPINPEFPQGGSEEIVFSGLDYLQNTYNPDGTLKAEAKTDPYVDRRIADLNALLEENGRPPLVPGVTHRTIGPDAVAGPNNPDGRIRFGNYSLPPSPSQSVPDTTETSSARTTPAAKPKEAPAKAQEEFDEESFWEDAGYLFEG